MVAVGFLTATLKKCFFIMLWLKIKNNFILCVRSVTIFDRFFKVITVLKNLLYLSFWKASENSEESPNLLINLRIWFLGIISAILK